MISRRGQKGPPIINDWTEQNRVLANAILSSARSGEVLRVLEAGCGTRWPLKLHGVDIFLTGVDTDRHALNLRQEKHGDLDEIIEGDLREVAFPTERFDVIYCAFVLEHINGAEDVLDRFREWLKPGGLLLIRIPDRDTVFGFIARILPFWCHVAYKKYVDRLPNAGKPGHDPFPTYYDAVVSRQGMTDYCLRHHLEILVEFVSNHYLPRLGRLAPPVWLLTKFVEYASLRRLDADYNNLAYVIQKPLSD